jgi:7,8-dihydropterin-6-yl-methyl-4-(beta-D-ribofuranosyl)aminobenzene 5'-phosphate synthase
MMFRISPIWWPVLGLTSPILLLFLMKKNKDYKNNRIKADSFNKNRIDKSKALNLPEVESLEIKVLVEWKTKKGFMGDAGVSYLFSTEYGSMLFDIGHGSENRTMVNNAEKLNFNLNQVDGLTISHLHKDHMGGMKAAKEKTVMVPEELMTADLINCYLPDDAAVEDLTPVIVEEPQLLKAGIATTGPLARSLFFLGYTKEQALIINLKNKGLAVFTGCGHPTIEIILDMVKKISDEPIYSIGGGLHFPITKGRGDSLGFELQRIFGTGISPWEKLDKNDLIKTAEAINSAEPQKVFLSGHDSCDYSLNYLGENLNADVEILKAGESYKI